MSIPKPFTLHVSDDDIADLRTRLARTRFPDQAPDTPWAYGTDLEYLRGLVAYWRDSFDWRAQEARLNTFPQFTVPLHGIDLHYLHVPGQGPDPKPLLLLHGWPGSVFEFIDIIPRLSDPARFGGDAKDAVTVIAPSLPGYGLSFQPNQKRFGIADMADCFADLMTQVLGHQKFAAQGGDWGAFTCSALGVRHADKLAGIHLNMLSVNPNSPPPANPTPEEQRYADEIRLWAKEETGYIQIQGTRPQTLAYGLTDSPAGLAAWIAEKFHIWTDHAGDFESVVHQTTCSPTYRSTGSPAPLVPPSGLITIGCTPPGQSPMAEQWMFPPDMRRSRRKSAARRARLQRRSTPASGNGR
jgi:pimeloyl-ACP methyl ester carboxylesterase